MSPFTGLLRSALGVAEHEQHDALEHSPLHTTAEVERDAVDLAHGLRRVAASADRQAELLERVGQSVPALTEQVTGLTAQVTAMTEQAMGINRRLGELLNRLEPLASAERDASRVERLFRRRRPHDGKHS